METKTVSKNIKAKNSFISVLKVFNIAVAILILSVFAAQYAEGQVDPNNPERCPTPTHYDPFTEFETGPNGARRVEIPGQPDCFIIYQYCYRTAHIGNPPNVEYRNEIYIHSMYIEGPCMEQLGEPGAFLMHYEEYINLCADDVVGSEEAFGPASLGAIPKCYEGVTTYFRIGHASCVTEPYYTAVIREICFPPCEKFILTVPTLTVSPCDQYDMGPTCWYTRRYCYELDPNTGSYSKLHGESNEWDVYMGTCVDSSMVWTYSWWNPIPLPFPLNATSSNNTTHTEVPAVNEYGFPYIPPVKPIEPGDPIGLGFRWKWVKVKCNPLCK